METIVLLLLSFFALSIVIGTVYILWMTTWTVSQGIVRMLHPLPRPGRCPHCQYDLRANKTEACPECGTPCDFKSLIHADRKAFRFNARLATLLCAALLIGLLVYGVIQMTGP